jgi:hypothetical protein
MFSHSFFSSPILMQGLFFGVISGAIGTVFTLASILIRFDRWVWLRLFDLNGISMFACCLIASVAVVRQTGKVPAAIMASVMAGVIGCLIYTTAQLAVPYALFEHLVHYPFLHEDFTNSGIPTIKEYLMSEKGYWGVVGTTVGMLQYALPFCILLASVLGLIGGSLGSSSKFNLASQQ